MWFGQIGFVWRIFLRLISGCFSFLVSQGLMGLKGILTRRELCGTNAPTPEALPLNPETEECSKALHGVFFRRKGFEFCERLIADKSPVVKFIHSKPPFLMTSWHHLTLKQWKVYAIAFFLQFDTGVGGSGAQAKKKKKKKKFGLQSLRGLRWNEVFNCSVRQQGYRVAFCKAKSFDNFVWSFFRVKGSMF